MLRNEGQGGTHAVFTFTRKRSITQIGHVDPSHWWVHVIESPLVSELINAVLVGILNEEGAD